MTMFMLFNVLNRKRHCYKRQLDLASRLKNALQRIERSPQSFFYMLEKSSGSWKETFYIPPCRKCLVPGGRSRKFCVVWKSPGHMTETLFVPSRVWSSSPGLVSGIIFLNVWWRYATLFDLLFFGT